MTTNFKLRTGATGFLNIAIGVLLRSPPMARGLKVFLVGILPGATSLDRVSCVRYGRLVDLVLVSVY